MPDVGSPQWIDALAASVGRLDAGDLHITVLHRVVDGPAWVLTAADGAVTAAPAEPDASADVTFTWEAGDVEAVASGRSTPLSVFQAGRLRVGGDLRRLTDATDLFATFSRGARLMPEVPEVQAHAERLDADFAGAVLDKFVPVTFTALKTFSPDPSDAAGQSLVYVGRRGKHLMLDFGTATFVVHLMQGGRLKPDEKQSAKPRGGIARWRFTDGRALLLTEAGTERKAGVWVVAGDPEGQPPLDDLGPEADLVDEAPLLDLLHANPGRIHGFLRDQRLVAGLGRRLANEICHRAKLSPFASTAKFDLVDATTLVEAIRACIGESLAYERGRDDMSSSKERPGNVHGRAGEACPVCGDTVRSVEYTRYRVDYCPTCQTDGKILADNTTSKFLK